MLNFFSEKPRASVSSIMADMKSKIAELKQLRDEESDRSDALLEQAAQLTTDANLAVAEARRADAVATNLEALLSA